MSIASELFKGAIDVVTNPVAKATAKKLKGPRPTGAMLQLESQIPGFNPTNVEEALYAGSKIYEGQRGKNAGKPVLIRQIDNPKYAGTLKAKIDAYDARKAGRKEQDITRNTRGELLTSGEDTFAVGAMPGTEAHHNMGLDQYGVFTPGLKPKEVTKLVSHVEQEHMRMLGNSQFNRLDLPKKVHNVLHRWEQMSAAKLQRNKLNIENRSLSERISMVDAYIQRIQPEYEKMAFFLMQNRNLPQKELMSLMESTLEQTNSRSQYMWSDIKSQIKNYYSEFS